MVSNVIDEPEDDSKAEIETVKSWQERFLCSNAEASRHIIQHREDLTRVKVSDEHWKMIRSENEAEGYDREAYNYSMTLGKGNVPLATMPPESQKPFTFLLKLEGPMATALKV